MDRPIIMLVEPTHYEVAYVINPWMRPDAWLRDRAAASKQATESWHALAGALEGAGARLEIQPGAPGLPDMVFPANAAIVLDRRALLARFRCPERQGEETHTAAFFAKLRGDGLIDAVASFPEDCFQEGAGDCIWDATRGHFWGGFGQRSVRASLDVAEGFFGRRVVPLELATERFYHLDTCFCPLSGGEVLFYPPAFTPDSLARIHDAVPADQRIEATDEDAARFCVNAVNIGRAIIMAEPAPALRARLAERGYAVTGVDLSPYILSGGGAYCMTLRLDRSSR